MGLDTERASPKTSPPEVGKPATGHAPTDTDLSPTAGLDCAIANAAGDWWFHGAMLAVRQLARSGRGFTVDHVLDMVGAPTDSHYLGALFAAAMRQRIVEPVGARVGRDGRLVRVWWGIPA
jgi:hypothetical protein